MTAKKIKLNLNLESFGCSDTSIGELCIFSVNMKDQSELYKSLDKPKKDIIPNDYVKAIVKYICFPKESLKDGKYKPEFPILEQEEIAKLSDEDLEKIAKIYIDNNPYLYKKLETKKEKKKNGEVVTVGAYSEITHPKNNDESYVEYLHRLSILEDEDTAKRFKDLYDSISGFGNFSASLTENIKKTLSWGDSLSQSLEALKPIQKETFNTEVVNKTFENLEPKTHTPVEKIISSLPHINLAKMERENEERRLKPFTELSSRLDQLIDSSVQASEFMIKANEIQTIIASEIKASSDTTTIFSKRNIVLSIVVIIISVISFIFTVYSIISATSAGQTQQSCTTGKAGGLNCEPLKAVENLEPPKGGGLFK